MESSVDFNKLLPERQNFKISGSGDSITVEDAKKILSEFSSSDYSDLSWEFDKYRPDYNYGTKRLTFYSFNPDSPLMDDIKLWVVQNLVDRKSVKTISSFLVGIRVLATHVFPGLDDASELNQNDILEFYNFIFTGERFSKLSSNHKRNVWLSVRQFYHDRGYFDHESWMKKYQVPSYKLSGINEAQLIPKSVLRQLDDLFESDYIPVVNKVIYWTLRLIPNRISEVMSLKTNCLKKLNNDLYTLTIPTFKEAGPYNKGELRIIEINYEGIGKKYVDLLLEQTQTVKELMPESEFLLVSYDWVLKEAYQPCFHYPNSKIRVYNGDRFQSFLRKIIKLYDIRNDEGELARITTQMFRHNAISDRVNSGIFRVIDIASLTGHHNSSVIEKVYLHPDPKNNTEKLKELEPERNDVALFQGRIIGSNSEKRYERILKRKFAFEIPNLGVCSDIRDCSKSKFECLACPYLIPEVENLDYYVNQKKEWGKKLLLAEATDSEYFIENCRYNISLYDKLIERILSQLTDSKVDLEVLKD